jgi:phosphate starvation-inducible PhoH-like protein
VLNKVDGIGFTFFTARDVVRHPLVQRIVRAYERREAPNERTPAADAGSGESATDDE